MLHINAELTCFIGIKLMLGVIEFSNIWCLELTALAKMDECELDGIFELESAD